jgi:nicotinamide-nucleotide amidase
MDDLFRASANPSLAYLAGGGEVKLRLTAKAPSRTEAEALIAPVAEEIERRLGDHVFSTDDQDLEGVVGHLLKSSQRTVATAESLTGGGLAVRLSRAPGASAYFKGSAVTYTADAKRNVLGVSEATIREHGVVSEECAREMAEGARRVFDADIGVALTGVAGPEPHDGKPVGTVCVGLVAEGAIASRCFRGPGDRDMVRRWAEQAGLDLLRRHLEGGGNDASRAPEPGSSP